MQGCIKFTIYTLAAALMAVFISRALVVQVEYTVFKDRKSVV